MKPSKRPFFLFREPRKFEYLRTLVDGAHWQGQKKLKRPDRSGRGGHLGCLEGFNFNLKERVLFQGREQMHSRLTKLTSSLCQMNYNSFMIFLCSGKELQYLPLSVGWLVCLSVEKISNSGFHIYIRVD